VKDTPDSLFFAFGVAGLIAGASTEGAPQRRDGNFARASRDRGAREGGVSIVIASVSKAIQSKVPSWIASSRGSSQ
jgi:hypothetical protein